MNNRAGVGGMRDKVGQPVSKASDYENNNNDPVVFLAERDQLIRPFIKHDAKIIVKNLFILFPFFVHFCINFSFYRKVSHILAQNRIFTFNI